MFGESTMLSSLSSCLLPLLLSLSQLFLLFILLLLLLLLFLCLPRLTGEGQRAWVFISLLTACHSN